MDVEVILAPDVVCREFSKVNFIEAAEKDSVKRVLSEPSSLDLHDFVRVIDLVETCHESEECKNARHK